MNALLFSASIATSALAALAFQPQPRPVPSEPTPASVAAVPAGERAWDAHLAAFLQDSDGYRARALQQIEDYAKATRSLHRARDASRGYLSTRLQALHEHVDYARAELLKLPVSEGDPDFTPAHAHFYRTMSGLQDAVTQAIEELHNGA